jgi:predicted dehydrogenase
LIVLLFFASVLRDFAVSVLNRLQFDAMKPVKRYAIVGTGYRATMYLDAIASEYRRVAQLVGMCDTCQARMDFHNKRLAEQFRFQAAPTFVADQFDQMIRQTRPDWLIVTSPDHTHDDYIIRAMHHGCDVICEKPLTIDAPRLRAIIHAIEKTRRSLRVTFNLRYAPHTTKLWEVINAGTIGKPLAVDFSWVLDTDHGADYFRRWHAKKHESGGLLVHKATHHFDLVNWWIGSVPQRVFAIGALQFYGQTRADVPAEPFFMPPESLDPIQQGLYFGQALSESGYIRNQDVFGQHVTIEDTMALVCRYRNGVVMNHSLVCYSPWEGFRVAITGTKGRAELFDRSTPHSQQTLTIYPMFGQAYEEPLPKIEAVHGGADPHLFRRLFDPDAPPDPFKRDAGYVDGAASVLLGIAANESIRTGHPIDVDDLFKLP